MKKGFTLIELLGVIILLGVLALIVYPVVDSSIKTSRQKAYEQTVRSILDAAKMYGTSSKLSVDANLETISLEELKKDGYLKNEDLINPMNKQVMEGCVIYSWNEAMNQFEYNYDENCIPTTPARCFNYKQKRYVNSFTIHYDNCITYISTMDWGYSDEELDVYCQGKNAYDGYNMKRDLVEDNLFIDSLITNNIVSNVVYENGAVITGYDMSCGTDVVIPNTISGLPIKELKENSFTDRPLEEIGLNNNYLVYNSSISIPKTYLADRVSYGYITSVDFSQTRNLEYIGSEAFYGNQITTLTFGENSNIAYISSGAFAYNQITTLTLPSTLRYIASEAFYRNDIQTIEIATGIQYIGSSAFARNQLTTLALPNTVHIIESATFEGNNLTYIQVDNVYNAITGSPWGAVDATINWLQSTAYTATIPNDVSISSNCAYNGKYYSGCVGEVNSVNGKVTSYKLNGVLQNGRNITIPDSNFTITDVVTVPIFIIESMHPYENNMNETYTKTVEGANSLNLQFSDTTIFENSYDKLKIYDKNDTLIGTYTGTQLSNKTILITGDTVKLIFTTDGSVTKYGFYVEVSKAS